MSRLLLSGVIAVALALTPASPSAQARPYTIEQLKILIQGGLPAASILRRASQNCLAFRLDEAAVRELRTAGATAQVLDGLREACVRLPEETPPVQPPARTDTIRIPARDTARAPARTDTARAVTPPDPARGVPRRDTARAVVPPPASPVRAEPAPPQVFSPGGAMVKSILLPGLGQFGTRRPAVGAVFLAGGAGALAFGLMSKKTTIDCLARTEDGSCPSGQARDEAVERPMLVPGIAAFLAVGIVSGLEAAAGARRANARAGQDIGATPASSPGVHVELAPAVVEGGGRAAHLSLLRVRF